jgi:hypothetical protein
MEKEAHFIQSFLYLYACPIFFFNRHVLAVVFITGMRIVVWFIALATT